MKTKRIVNLQIFICLKWFNLSLKTVFVCAVGFWTTRTVHKDVYEASSEYVCAELFMDTLRHRKSNSLQTQRCRPSRMRRCRRRASTSEQRAAEDASALFHFHLIELHMNVGLLVTWRKIILTCLSCWMKVRVWVRKR